MNPRATAESTKEAALTRLEFLQALYGKGAPGRLVLWRRSDKKAHWLPPMDLAQAGSITRGWWYEAWRSEEPWERYRAPAEECPRISREFLEEERRAMGEWWFAQEYACDFLDAETQPFGREDVERAFEEEVEAWDL